MAVAPLLLLHSCDARHRTLTAVPPGRRCCCRPARCLLAVCLRAGLVVVVSPLLSLMHDQVSRLPACLPGAMLQGTMGRDEVLQVGHRQPDSQTDAANQHLCWGVRHTLQGAQNGCGPACAPPADTTRC